ncbi:MAG: hypothetical protein AB7R55_17505 [Gemmatimonadales bacterium]
MTSVDRDRLGLAAPLRVRAGGDDLVRGRARVASERGRVGGARVAIGDRQWTCPFFCV